MQMLDFMCDILKYILQKNAILPDFDVILWKNVTS